MTEGLKITIEKLYKIFSIYPLKSVIKGCPCCISNFNKEQLHSKELRNLEEEDLSKYIFKAMTTWGDTEDFKHYLPRIFELLSKTNFIVDAFVVLGKLEYGRWKTWDKKEQEVIIEFLLAWWSDLIKHKYFDKEIFIELYKLTGEIDKLLDEWSLEFKNNSFENYVDFILDYYFDLTNSRKIFKELDDLSSDKLIQWTQNNLKALKIGFLYFDKKNEKLAKKILTTKHIYEWRM